MILTIIILAVFAVYIFQGYKQGFAKVAFSLAAWLVGLIAAYILTPMVADALIANTDLAPTIEAVVIEQVTDAVGGLDVKEFKKLPEAVQELLVGDYESVEQLIQAGAVEAIDVSALTNSIINSIALVLTLFITRLGLMLAEKILIGVTKIPLIGPLNKLLGLAAGALKALIWSWIILALVDVVTFTGYNTSLMAEVMNSEILTWLYEKNLIIVLIHSFL